MSRMSLAAVLRVLSMGVHARTKSIFLQVVLHVAAMLDGSTWLAGGSTAVADVPLPRGTRKRRRVPQVVKEMVVEWAADASFFRSTSKIMLYIARKQGHLNPAAAAGLQNWVLLRVARYWACCQAVLRSASPVYLTIAWDGTRVGLREHLFGVLYSPGLGKGFWLPPQVQALFSLRVFR